MPDISKINAVAIADIEKLDAVLAANLAKVNGLVFSTAPGFVGLLDTYTGAAAGYSTRRLASSATNLMRIREDAGDTETDIGYDSNGDLDTAAIATHCGTANGFVVSWVDQSGNANDADQATNASQPQIYDGTAVITQDGKPALDYNGAQNVFLTNRIYDASMSVFCVWKCDSSAISNDDGIYSFSDTDRFALQANRYAVNQLITRHTGASSIGGTTTTTNQNLTSHLRTGSVATLHANASALTTSVANANTSGGDNAIGISGSAPLSGYVWELVAYSGTTDGDQTTNRPAIEGNVNAHYQIGNFGTPTSGLLATYTGAAAAYSVRQLANTAALSMRVREDATDTETNIGFDANGDLDTAAIAAHCGTANGYVVNWFDQAGSQNDATQSTLASQPQIYNGTAVITENGKASLDFNGSNALSINVTGTATNLTAFFVRSFSTYPVNYSNGFHYKTRGIGYVSGGLPIYRLAHLISGTSDVQRAATYPTTTGQALDYFFNQSELYRNSTNMGLSTGSSYGSNAESVIGGWKSTSQRIIGEIQELVLYESDQSSNRTGIESDIMTYFSIT